jgi:hypothetical protein
MNTKAVLVTLILMSSIVLVRAQLQDTSQVERKHFIGSTLFVAFTPLLNPSPRYYQLNYGYQLSAKDVLSVEAITWTYQGPLGRPYGSDNKDSDFEGSVRAYGMGLAYKRFIWKGAYAALHSTLLHQNYLDAKDNKIQSGIQLFNTFRLGYHLKFFKNRLFLEPSLALTYWPINTNLPQSFQEEENKWPNYFLFEPGLHFGYKF